MNSYAVVFTYSFDIDTPVYLFDNIDEAKAFLEQSYLEKMRIDKEENGWDASGSIGPQRDYAVIKDIFGEHVDITEIRLGNVYASKEE